MIRWPTTDGEGWRDSNGEVIECAPLQPSRSIPLFVAEEGYKEYVEQFSNSQDLNCLNQRGGFGAAELCILLYYRIKRLEGKNAD
jgi:hypothetical protein